MDKGKIHLRIDQHNMVKLRQEVTQLRLVGLQELPPNGHIKKEVGDLDIRANGAYAGLLAYYVRSVYLNKRTCLVFRSAGGHLHLRHGAYRSECFPAKTHRPKREQILSLTDLTCRVTLKSQTGIHLTHADTVIYHLQQCPTGITNNDLNTGGSRIQTVLH